MENELARNTKNPIQVIKGLILEISQQLNKIEGAIDHHYKEEEDKP